MSLYGNKVFFRSDVLIGNVTQPLKYYKPNTEENMHKNTKKYAAVALGRLLLLGLFFFSRRHIEGEGRQV